MSWTDPRTWATGETVTAAMMNAHVRDNFNAIGEYNTTWTPAWSCVTTPPALGNGTLIGRYTDTAEWVDFFIHLTAGSTTTFGSGAWQFDLPVNSSNRLWFFDALALDASLSDYYRLAFPRTAANLIVGRRQPTTAGGPMLTMSGAAPFAWGTNDELLISGRYAK